MSYSFPLRLTLRYLKTEGIVPQPDVEHPEFIRLGKTTIPPFKRSDGGYVDADDAGYQFLLDYRSMPASFQTYSLSDLLAGRVPAESIRDKIVMIGGVAESLKDYFYTPFSRGLGSDQRIYGLELHAHIVSQLLRFATAGIPPIKSSSDVKESIWVWIWCLLGGLLGLWLRALWRFALAILSGLLILGLLCYMAYLDMWWVPLVPPAMGWFIAAAVTTSYMSNHEKVQRQLLMQLFARHVSPDVAEAIWQEREQFLEGGRPRSQRLTATVLFTDIKGFTSVSEKMDAQRLMEWLNTYMEPMAQTVMSHGGVIDKYIGDAIMAIFGVPLPRRSDSEIAQDAVNAVNCALDMEQRLNELNAAWKVQGLPAIGMRVGIYTGPLVAGSLGSAERLEYTVIGDTVNTASRLESFDKGHASPEDSDSNCRILIGESTRRYLDTQFETRHFGLVTLKGKEEEVAIYRVTRGSDRTLGAHAEASPNNTPDKANPNKTR